MTSKKSRNINGQKKSRKNLSIILWAVLGSTLLLLALYILDPSRLSERKLSTQFFPVFRP